MQQEISLNLFSQLLEKIKQTSLYFPININCLMQNYNYLLDYMLVYDPSLEECQSLMKAFKEDVLPLLFSEGYYETLREQFIILKNTLEKQKEKANSEMKELITLQLNHTGMHQKTNGREFVLINDIEQYQIVNDEKFKETVYDLKNICDSASKLKEPEIYLSALIKLIHFLLSGHKNANNTERYNQITTALYLCSEGLAFLRGKKEKTNVNAKYFNKLINICFAYFFIVPTKFSSLDKLPICFSGLRNCNKVQEKIALLERILKAAEQITLHTQIMVNDEKCLGNDFVELAIQKVKNLYQQIVDWVKNDYFMLAVDRLKFVKNALEKLVNLDNIVREKKEKSKIKAEVSITLIDWCENKQVLKNLRDYTKARLEKEPIGNTLEIVRHFNQEIKKLIQSIFEQCVLLIGNPFSFEYVLLSFGSLARDEACPFSDIEYGFLVEEAGLSEKNKAHTYVVLKLFELSIIALGESYQSGNEKDTFILPGFRLDKAYNPLNTGINITLWGTAKDIAAYIDEENIGDLEGLNAIQSAGIIAGSHNSENLYQAFQKNVKENLDKLNNNTKLRQKVAEAIINVNAKDPDLTPFDFENAVKINNIKSNLLRPVVFLLGALNASHELEALNSIQRLEKLQSQEKIHPTIAKILKLYFAFALRLRYFAHFHYGAETEETLYLNFVPENKNLLYLDERSHHILMSFRKSIIILLNNCFEDITLLFSQLPQSYEVVIPALIIIAKEYHNDCLWKHALEYYTCILEINAQHEEASMLVEQLQKKIMDDENIKTKCCKMLSTWLIEAKISPALKELISDYLANSDNISYEMIGLQNILPWKVDLSLAAKQVIRLVIMVGSFFESQTRVWEVLRSFYAELPSNEYRQYFEAEFNYWQGNQIHPYATFKTVLKNYYTLAAFHHLNNPEKIMEKEYIIQPELLENLQSKQEILFFKEALKLYVPARLGQYKGDSEPQDAAQVVFDWLNNSSKQCLLLLGDSGVGKTLFLQSLTQDIFKHPDLYKHIPLFISLLIQNNSEQNLIDYYLEKTCKITEESQRESIKQQPLLLILDDFDEVCDKINFYRSNEFFKRKDVKIIITCRPQALENSDCYNFFTYLYKKQHHKLEEYIINSFTPDQISIYCQKYFDIYQDKLILINPDWRCWEDYYYAIQKLPNLQILLKSPLLLSLVLQVLPLIIEEYNNTENIEQLCLTRVNLYDYFIKQWFAYQKLRLLNEGYVKGNFSIEHLFMGCSKSIANAMLQNKKNSIELIPNTISSVLSQQGIFTHEKSKYHIKNGEIKYRNEEIFIDGDKIKLSLILSCCPLTNLDDNRYVFLHKSFQEYFAAEKLFSGVMLDTSIAIGCELNEKLLTGESEILKFLAERVQGNQKFKERLFDILEESKYDEHVEIAAANAITILNYADISFSQKALDRIRIKGADLSNAMLDTLNLNDADIRQVNLKGTSLNNTKLCGAIMQDVKLGEIPYLEFKAPITCAAYSPDGRYLAAGTQDGSIHLWEFAAKKWATQLKEHTQKITCLTFSSNSSYLASGSKDKLVCLWSVLEHKILGVLSGHTDCVYSVAFSHDGSCLASGGLDYTVRLWDVIGRKSLNILNGHTGAVTSIAFSPDGSYFISGGYDKTLRFWGTFNHKFLTMLYEHTDFITSIAFSSDGNYFVSVGYDKIVRLWNAKSKAFLGKLVNSRDYIDKVIFSPDSKCLAVVCREVKSVFLWDIETKKCLNIWKLKSFVSDVDFRKEKEETCINICSSNACYTFKIKPAQAKFNFIPDEHIEGETGLSAEQLDLEGVVGLDFKDYTLLKQRNAIGNLSTKEISESLESRGQLSVPYNPQQPQYAIFDKKYLLTPSCALVSVGYKKDSKHPFLIIESIQNNHYSITRADYIIDLREKYTQKELISIGRVLIVISIKTLTDTVQLLNQCSYKSWLISEKQAFDLLSHLEHDSVEHINHLSLMDYLCYYKSEQKTNSFQKWHEKYLNQIGINMNLEKFYSNTTIRNNLHTFSNKGNAGKNSQDSSNSDQISKKENNPDTKQNCLMM